MSIPKIEKVMFCKNDRPKILNLAKKVNALSVNIYRRFLKVNIELNFM